MRGDWGGRATRRRLLRGAAAAGMLASLAACGDLPPALNPLHASARGTATSAGGASTGQAGTGAGTTSAAGTGNNTTRSGSASAVATPSDVPGAVAAAFLAGWNDGRYADMYDLISAEAQQKIAKDDFVQRYGAIKLEATITKIAAALDPGQRPSANIQRFSVRFDTVLVGTVEEQNSMTLAVDPDGRQWKVQWLPSLIFKELTGDNLIHMYPIGTARGDIVDRSGRPLATIGNVASVYLKPGEIKDEAAMLAQVSQLLNLPQAVIKQQYAQSQADQRVDLKTLSLAEAAPIRAKLAAIPGIHVVDEPNRVYPHGTLASQTIGYLSQVNDEDLKQLAGKGYRPGDVIGRAGIEQWGEPYLAGHWGGKLMVTSRAFDPLTTIAVRAPEKAGSVALTIDIGLQGVCEGLLGTRPGSIGVMRVADGSLLALAGYPGFDPNQFVLGISSAAYAQLVNDPQTPFLNRLVDGRYPTGSVFKPITMAAALDRAGFTADSAFDCPGSYTLGDTTWHCWKPSGHGHIGIVSALVQSCDVAFYTMGHAEDTRSSTLLPDEATASGLGSPTHIVGLPDNAGVVPSPAWKEATYHAGWVPGDAVNLSIGQGSLLASPLQVLNLYAALANGGTLWTPRIVDKVLGPDGTVVDANPPKALGTLPDSAGALALIREGLRGVVADPLGTATPAFKGLAVAAAGKTGTAQAGQGDPHAWFAAYAPADQAEIAVVVMVEHGGEGADVAAPLARRVIEAYTGAKH